MIQGDCTPGTSSGASQRQLQQEFRENVSIFTDQPLQSSHIVVKPPVFLKSSPHIFFIQIETSFRRTNISRDDTKYDHVVGALDAQIRELDKYECLTKQNYRGIRGLRIEKNRKLLNDVELGDRKPSQLLRHMRHLAGNSVSETILKSWWIERLPVTLRACFIIGDEDLDICAKRADTIMDFVRSTSSQVMAVKAGASTPHKNEQFEEILNNIKALTQAVANLATQLTTPGDHSRSRSRSGNSQNARSSSGDNGNAKPFCRYHYKFGGAALKCAPPCKFNDKSPEN